MLYSDCLWPTGGHVSLEGPKQLHRWMHPPHSHCSDRELKISHIRRRLSPSKTVSMSAIVPFFLFLHFWHSTHKLIWDLLKIPWQSSDFPQSHRKHGKHKIALFLHGRWFGSRRDALQKHVLLLLVADILRLAVINLRVMRLTVLAITKKIIEGRCRKS